MMKFFPGDCETKGGPVHAQDIHPDTVFIDSDGDIYIKVPGGCVLLGNNYQVDYYSESEIRSPACPFFKECHIINADIEVRLCEKSA